MNYKELQKLKTAISEILLDHIADKLDMTVGEYGSVYDSGEHERVLNKMLPTIQPLLKQAELRADIKYHTLKARYERMYLGGDEDALRTKQYVKKLKDQLKAEMENLS